MDLFRSSTDSSSEESNEIWDLIVPSKRKANKSDSPTAFKKRKKDINTGEGFRNLVMSTEVPKKPNTTFVERLGDSLEISSPVIDSTPIKNFYDDESNHVRIDVSSPTKKKRPSTFLEVDFHRYIQGSSSSEDLDIEDFTPSFSDSLHKSGSISINNSSLPQVQSRNDILVAPNSPSKTILALRSPDLLKSKKKTSPKISKLPSNYFEQSPTIRRISRNQFVQRKSNPILGINDQNMRSSTNIMKTDDIDEEITSSSSSSEQEMEIVNDDPLEEYSQDTEYMMEYNKEMYNDPRENIEVYNSLSPLESISQDLFSQEKNELSTTNHEDVIMTGQSDSDVTTPKRMKIIKQNYFEELESGLDHSQFRDMMKKKRTKSIQDYCDPEADSQDRFVNKLTMNPLADNKYKFELKNMIPDGLADTFYRQIIQSKGDQRTGYGCMAFIIREDYNVSLKIHSLFCLDFMDNETIIEIFLKDNAGTRNPNLVPGIAIQLKMPYEETDINDHKVFLANEVDIVDNRINHEILVNIRASSSFKLNQVLHDGTCIDHRVYYFFPNKIVEEYDSLKLSREIENLSQLFGDTLNIKAKVSEIEDAGVYPINDEMDVGQPSNISDFISFKIDHMYRKPIIDRNESARIILNDSDGCIYKLEIPSHLIEKWDPVIKYVPLII
eukprot:TRINITY_DN9084_c0_g1_i3.p1 TRINITY_DN9084_c0_g1~~TRINITY_DN9084_c0_g1_i3.p1  ORF type:complete len:667 (-),score=135.58 TRINITY_DN9084_c0_g1_i3:315-2315(-)